MTELKTLKDELLTPISPLDKLFSGWNLEEIKEAYIENKIVIELLRNEFKRKIN